LQAFGVSWNKQEFNQGSPKPDGSSPGNTTPVTGTYNAATGTYVLQWSSQVVGGPFNGFSAFWNLTGRFVPAASPSAAGPASGPSAAASTVAGASSARSTGGAGTATPRTGTAPASTGTTAASAAPTDGTTFGTSASPSGSSTSSAAKETRTVLSSRTVVTGDDGWKAPIWLVVLAALIALAGLAGVLVSERALRRLRTAVAE
jgi:hypothetical protein